MLELNFDIPSPTVSLSVAEAPVTDSLGDTHHAVLSPLLHPTPLLDECLFLESRTSWPGSIYALKISTAFGSVSFFFNLREPRSLFT
jgi:hypothetical protein